MVLLLRWQQDAGVVQFIQPLCRLRFPKAHPRAPIGPICRLNPRSSCLASSWPTSSAGSASAPAALYARGRLTAEEIQAFFRVTVRPKADFADAFAGFAPGLASPENVPPMRKTDMAQRQVPAGTAHKALDHSGTLKPRDACALPDGITMSLSITHTSASLQPARARIRRLQAYVG